MAESTLEFDILHYGESWVIADDYITEYLLSTSRLCNEGVHAVFGRLNRKKTYTIKLFNERPNQKKIYQLFLTHKIVANYLYYPTIHSKYEFLLELHIKGKFHKIDLPFSSHLEPNNAFLRDHFTHYDDICSDAMTDYPGFEIFVTVKEKKEVTVKNLTYESDLDGTYVNIEIELSDGRVVAASVPI